MRIVNLIENTAGKGGCLFEHGLSFYVETKRHKLLMDTGASGAFLENAKRLGIDLGLVDTVVISHGHYDHTGGLAEFVRLNSKAKIWIHRLAGEAYYHKGQESERYIGIDPQIRELEQAEWVEGNRWIDDGLFLFGGVSGRKWWPSGNRELQVKKGGVFWQDTFCHEQYLVVLEGGKRVLLSGCAHNGIINILDTYRELLGGSPDAVVSGFHMRKKGDAYTQEELDIFQKTAEELKKWDTRFFTGHCTGEIPYRLMKECMGGQLAYVHSGEEILL